MLARSLAAEPRDRAAGLAHHFLAKRLGTNAERRDWQGRQPERHG